MGSGQELWEKAKKLIPGGSMLLSKRSEMFLPGRWPSYFKKTRGCHIWDLDDQQYLDMCIMGIGTNILGYSHHKVDQEVIRAALDGNMSTFNCPEEVQLAEKLVQIHPWADMVRFARSGGEANTIAIRLARASTGRDAVAICGYHGWHDWYLSTNLNDTDSLNEHLLPGLEPTGVPKGLKGTVIPFRYNQIDQLEEIVKTNCLAAIKMEVERNEPPKDNFLLRIRNLCDQHGIVLIFDECTSGFRETQGGLHLKYNINPDISVFGKALGNGYAISCVIGIESVMQAAQKSFISSTFWTERIGPTAGIAALDVMQDTQSWDVITNIGRHVRESWQDIAQSHNVDISCQGIPALSNFRFNSKNHLKYKTFITQEMIKNNILATTTLYASIAHTEQYVEVYLSCLNDIFSLIGKCESGDANIDELLEVPVCHDGFARLN